MTYFHQLRSLKSFRMASSVLLFALASTLTVFAQRGGDNDPDRAVAGGQFPAGWNVRPDRGTPAQIKFSQAGDVYHFSMGPAGTFYRADWTKSGNYTFSARVMQRTKASHPTSYGLMFGGTNMGTPTISYTYFLVRQGGEFFVSNWEGAGPTTVVNWTANPAIVKEGADGKQSNKLGVQVQGDNVIFTVNGAEMTRLPKSKVHTDGMFGFRIGHNLDIDV